MHTEFAIPAGPSPVLFQDRGHALQFQRLPWRDPVRMTVPENITLAEMAALVPGLPAAFWTAGAIYVDGHLVHREFWHVVRLRGGRRAVHLALPPGGGGSDNPVAIIAALALVVLTGGIAAGALAPALGAGFAAGTLGANIAAAGIGLAGQLLIKALFPPPVVKPPQAEQALGQAVTGDNVLEAGAPIPRVIGTHRVKPPLAAWPRTYIDGDDQIAEGLFALAGPHALEDARLGDVPLAEDPNITVETREGWDSDTPITLIREQVRQQTVDVKLSKHLLRNSSDSDTAIAQDIAAEKAIPQWHRVVTRKGPDQVTFGFTFAGIFDGDATGQKQRLHLRWRVRKRGDTAWMNLSELRYLGRTTGQKRLEVRLILDRAIGASVPTAPTDNTFTGVDDAIPAVAVDHVVTKTGTAQWTSDFTLEGKVAPHRNGINIYPDDSWFQDPDAVFEFEFKRSEMIQATNWLLGASVPTNYVFTTTVRDPFDAEGHSSGEWRLRDSPKGKTSNEVVLNHVTSHWRDHPVAVGGLTLIAVRARNRDISNFSVRASGYVRDWDGVAWQKWRTTSNPAPHYRDVLAGDLSADPLPAARVSDDQLVDWRTECTARGYAVNAVMDGKTVSEARRIIAAAGFAEPRQSEAWGISHERDRSAERVRQVFTPRNTANFTASKAFNRRPRALRASYLDAANLFEPAELLVDDPNVDATSISEPEAIEYPGLTTEAEVQRRALYDMNQAIARSIIYSFDCDFERLQVQRGDLVGLNTDVLERQVGWARVRQVSANGLTVTIDNDWPFLTGEGFFDVDDLFDRTDTFLLGKQSGVVARTADGTVTIATVSAWIAETRTLTLASKIAGLAAGDLMAVGPVGKEYRRCLVQSVQASAGLTGRISLVDEAPEILPAAA